MDNYDEETLIRIATDAFVRELGLQDDTLLQGGKIEMREVPAGTYLMKEDSHKVIDWSSFYISTFIAYTGFYSNRFYSNWSEYST